MLQNVLPARKGPIIYLYYHIDDKFVEHDRNQLDIGYSEIGSYGRDYVTDLTGVNTYRFEPKSFLV